MYNLGSNAGHDNLTLFNGCSVNILQGKNCLDLSGNGPVASGPNTSNTGPKAFINDTDSSGATLNNIYSITPSTTFTGITFTCWMYFTNSQAYGNMFDFASSTGGGTLLFGQEANASTLKYYINSVRSSVSTHVNNKWYFSALVVTTSNYTAYFNDATLAFSTTPVANASISMTINSDRIGTFGVSSYSDPGMYGYFADFRMYGTALSVSDITTIFNSGSS